MFNLMDRNSDGKLTEREIQDFMAVQMGASSAYASITVGDQGRNLFQLLDANGDGRLSPRELKSVWERLKARDADGDGAISAGELTRQFQILADRGAGQAGGRVVAFPRGFAQPPPRPASYAPKTPLWFKRMDRNGDGDVSAKEWLGTRDEFQRIDADRDGLISQDEAVAFEEKLREKRD
jgi:Ca2+-binding EF-hand superfamily protein